jgi:Uma2 family endonuclease
MLQTQRPTDTWVPATWAEYLHAVEDPACEKAKGYYYNGKMRLEMPPVGNDHACDHSIVSYAVNLYAGIKGIDLNGRDNCSYRKAGLQECQPDMSFLIAKNASAIPYGTGIVDLNRYPAPDLVIEVANSLLSSDNGEKRLLYEELGVAEYWIIDEKDVRAIAFAVQDGGSRRIRQSQVLPGLDIELIQEALQLTRQMNHGKVSAWLLSRFQDVNA